MVSRKAQEISILTEVHSIQALQCPLQCKIALDKVRPKCLVLSRRSSWGVDNLGRLSSPQKNFDSSGLIMWANLDS